MYVAVLFWISGILFTYGFSDKMLRDHDSTFRTKALFALSIQLWFAWPLLLGDSLRRVLDKEYE